MAFSYTISTDPNENIGRLKYACGTYTNTLGSTGGDIVLTDMMSRIINFNLQPVGSAVSASAPAVNETIPLDGTAVTIVTVADEDGTWEAWGY